MDAVGTGQAGNLFFHHDDDCDDAGDDDWSGGQSSVKVMTMIMAMMMTWEARVRPAIL